jgi:hypothetical protein
MLLIKQLSTSADFPPQAIWGRSWLCQVPKFILFLTNFPQKAYTAIRHFPHDTLAGSRFDLTRGRFNLTGGKFTLIGGRFNLAGGRFTLAGGRFNLIGSRFNPDGGEFTLIGGKFNLNQPKNRPNQTQGDKYVNK